MFGCFSLDACFSLDETCCAIRRVEKHAAHTTQSEPGTASKEGAARTCAFAHTTQSANSYSPKHNSRSPQSETCCVWRCVCSPWMKHACFSLLSSGARSALDLECSDSPPPPTSLPAGPPFAALVTRRARRPTTASTASCAVEVAVGSDGCRKLLGPW